MKYVLIFYLSAFTFKIRAQSKFAGRYYTHFGEMMDINSDSTFKYLWRFDLSASWSNGSWRVEKDTIYFKMIPVYDTLEYKDKRTNTIHDSLVLSDGRAPKRITVNEIFFNDLFSGGQNFRPCPEKLFYRNGKLLAIYNGRLFKRRVRGIWIRKKFRPWFTKKEE
jgi:hypothetical protein